MEATSWKEEKANAISHGLAAILSSAAFVLLLVQSLKSGSMVHLLGSAVFGASLVILYVCSTLLHSATQEQEIAKYETLDHAAIYLLIAGTYTPFLLVLRHGPLGLCMLILIWGLTCLGITLKLVYPGRYMTFSIGQYLVMAWLIVFILRPLQQVLSQEGMLWLIGGILLYSIGSIFYFWRGIRYHHAIWHIFVSSGSLCHFVAVYAYVLPLLAD
ncbi:PAQR family membrane homeostasis protein TrhA [Paenibacillus sp. OAS669]|uniref:PAQR family membrane homeostasis protein TrhA n=1 Tax=Paenibacillus sp. OAS669 TaxID=2663821 RepID=UPI00178A2FF1|nr:hemolysin III family protein [Paenibacillus sp. OAS669]MBE1441914.1 hemolysin III [Paenibacillus sp. OAS669]